MRPFVSLPPALEVVFRHGEDDITVVCGVGLAVVEFLPQHSPK